MLFYKSQRLYFQESDIITLHKVIHNHYPDFPTILHNNILPGFNRAWNQIEREREREKERERERERELLLIPGLPLQVWP